MTASLLPYGIGRYHRPMHPRCRCPRLPASPWAHLIVLALGLLLAGCGGAPARDLPARDMRNASPAAREAGERTVVLVSIDGLPAQLLGTGALPALDALARHGTRARWMNPSYPTHTFPNHYTLVTGLRPDHHGIVHNGMDDPAIGRFVSKEDSALDSRWWGGEPIWTTFQRQGGIAATMFWPGSEVRSGDRRPRYFRHFDNAVSADQRVDQVLDWLDLPAAERPRLLLTYLNDYDVASHAAGMRSDEAKQALGRIDGALARLRRGLDARGLGERVDLIVVSDHGMVDVPRTHNLWLDDTLDTRHYDHLWWGPIADITPHPGSEKTVERAFLGRHRHFSCWRKQDLPARWHYGTHPRIPPIVCQVEAGWRLKAKSDPSQEPPVKGEHGYAPEDPSMRAVFVASGPSFRKRYTLPAFDNVGLYPLLAHLLRIEPAPNDGSLESTRPALSR